MNPFEVVGHRGAAGYEPENTIRAILKGIECGATAIEVDVRRTKDGTLILMHDETVDRTTNGSGRVADLTFDEIRRFDAGKGEKVPTLEEVLEVTKGKVKVFLELKEVGYEDKVVGIVDSLNAREYVWIISFHKEAIKNLKDIAPDIPTGLIFSALPMRNIDVAKELGVELVSPFYRLVSRRFIKEAKANGFKVIAWTINEVEDMVRMFRLGVDGITSDYPCLLREVIDSLSRGVLEFSD
ncbi:MAG: glycerophosphodiester phosphodiesterase [Thermoprotei archaeon]|nr:MAG: glycerophosphodiester phosphodiesterase [Thermoprotei archaeon]